MKNEPRRGESTAGEERRQTGSEVGPSKDARAAGLAVDVQVFVVNAPKDAWFVEGFPLPALSLPEEAVLVSSKLEVGAGMVKEIERGAVSPVTVVVTSPAFLASPWAQFASQLATQQSVEAAGGDSATLVPTRLVDCDLPLLSRFREPLDFRDRKRWEAEAAKLRGEALVISPRMADLPTHVANSRARGLEHRPVQNHRNHAALAMYDSTGAA